MTSWKRSPISLALSGLIAAGGATTAIAAKMSHLDMRASTLIGMEVKNSNGEDLGEIKDVIVDVNNGRVHYAVLEFGGFMGMGEKLFAYPIRHFKTGVAGERDELILNVDKKRLKAAPGFAKDGWPDWNESKHRGDVDRYYGPTVTIKAKPNMRLVRGSELLGKDVNDADGKDIGDLKDLVVDMRSGEVHYAVLAFDKSWSPDNKLFALPMKALGPADDPDELRINVTEAALENSPGFDEDAWPGVNLNDSKFHGALDRYLGSVTVTSLPPAYDSALFARLDRNKDGVLTKKEAGKHGKVNSAWNKLDNDRDGAVSRSEFIAFEEE